MKLKLNLKIDFKVFHLVVLWFIFFVTSFVLFLERGGHFQDSETEIIGNILVYLIVVELGIILLQVSLFISSFLMEVYFRVQEKKRKKIETNIFSWISDEKIGNVSELITILKLRDKEFDSNCKNSLDRYSYIKSYIRESLSDQDIKIWYSQLKVKDKDQGYMSFIIAIVLSFSMIKDVIIFIPTMYHFIMAQAPCKFVGRILFVEIVLLILGVLRGLLIYARLNSRLTSFFSVILNDIIEDTQKS
ncbi:hypothetical protein NGF69_16585 [Enterococcus casseliflavus]|nr:hypothetical protein [Enterococcus casseliflavus]